MKKTHKIILLIVIVLIFSISYTYAGCDGGTYCDNCCNGASCGTAHVVCKDDGGSCCGSYTGTGCYADADGYAYKCNSPCSPGNADFYNCATWGKASVECALHHCGDYAYDNEDFKVSFCSDDKDNDNDGRLDDIDIDCCDVLRINQYLYGTNYCVNGIVYAAGIRDSNYNLYNQKIYTCEVSIEGTDVVEQTIGDVINGYICTSEGWVLAGSTPEGCDEWGNTHVWLEYSDYNTADTLSDGSLRRCYSLDESDSNAVNFGRSMASRTGLIDGRPFDTIYSGTANPDYYNGVYRQNLGQQGNVGYFLSSYGRYVRADGKIDLQITNQITLAGWISGDMGQTTGQNIYIIGKPDSFALRIKRVDDTTGVIGMIFKKRDDPVPVGWNEENDATVNILDNNWHHVAATYDGSNIKLYVDGVLKKTSSGFGDSIYDSGQPLYFGAYAPSYGLFTGYLDELRVYNKALSDAEVSTLYTSQRNNPSRYCDANTNLLYCADFNDDWANNPFAGYVSSSRAVCNNNNILSPPSPNPCESLGSELKYTNFQKAGDVKLSDIITIPQEQKLTMFLTTTDYSSATGGAAGSHIFNVNNPDTICTYNELTCYTGGYTTESVCNSVYPQYGNLCKWDSSVNKCRAKRDCFAIPDVLNSLYAYGSPYTNPSNLYAVGVNYQVDSSLFGSDPLNPLDFRYLLSSKPNGNIFAYAFGTFQNDDTHIYHPMQANGIGGQWATEYSIFKDNAPGDDETALYKSKELNYYQYLSYGISFPKTVAGEVYTNQLPSCHYGTSVADWQMGFDDMSVNTAGTHVTKQGDKQYTYVDGEPMERQGANAPWGISCGIANNFQDMGLAAGTTAAQFASKFKKLYVSEFQDDVYSGDRYIPYKKSDCIYQPAAQNNYNWRFLVVKHGSVFRFNNYYFYCNDGTVSLVPKAKSDADELLCLNFGNTVWYQNTATGASYCCGDSPDDDISTSYNGLIDSDNMFFCAYYPDDKKWRVTKGDGDVSYVACGVATGYITQANYASIELEDVLSWYGDEEDGQCCGDDRNDEGLLYNPTTIPDICYKEFLDDSSDYIFSHSATPIVGVYFHNRTDTKFSSYIYKTTTISDVQRYDGNSGFDSSPEVAEAGTVVSHTNADAISTYIGKFPSFKVCPKGNNPAEISTNIDSNLDSFYVVPKNADGTPTGENYLSIDLMDVTGHSGLLWTLDNTKTSLFCSDEEDFGNCPTNCDYCGYNEFDSGYLELVPPGTMKDPDFDEDLSTYDNYQLSIKDLAIPVTENNFLQFEFMWDVDVSKEDVPGFEDISVAQICVNGLLANCKNILDYSVSVKEITSNENIYLIQVPLYSLGITDSATLTSVMFKIFLYEGVDNDVSRKVGRFIQIRGEEENYCDVSLTGTSTHKGEGWFSKDEIDEINTPFVCAAMSSFFGTTTMGLDDDNKPYGDTFGYKCCGDNTNIDETNINYEFYDGDEHNNCCAFGTVFTHGSLIDGSVIGFDGTSAFNQDGSTFDYQLKSRWICHDGFNIDNPTPEGITEDVGKITECTEDNRCDITSTHYCDREHDISEGSWQWLEKDYIKWSDASSPTGTNYGNVLKDTPNDILSEISGSAMLTSEHCCLENQCFNGLVCVDSIDTNNDEYGKYFDYGINPYLSATNKNMKLPLSKSAKQMADQYVCIGHEGASWQSAYYRESPYLKDADIPSIPDTSPSTHRPYGYCLYSTDCWNGTSCVRAGSLEATGRFFCEDGKWSNNAKKLLSMMIDIANDNSNDKFVIYCDSFIKPKYGINDPVECVSIVEGYRYNPVFNIWWNDTQRSLPLDKDDIFTQMTNEIFCVYMDKTKKVVLTSYTNDTPTEFIKFAMKLNYNLLKDETKYGGGTCKNVFEDNTDSVCALVDNYERYGNLKSFYWDKENRIFGWTDKNNFDFGQDLNQGYLSEFIEWIKSLFDWLFGTGAADNRPYINDIHLFNTFFIARDDDKLVRGFEEKISNAASTQKNIWFTETGFVPDVGSAPNGYVFEVTYTDKGNLLANRNMYKQIITAEFYNFDSNQDISETVQRIAVDAQLNPQIHVDYKEDCDDSGPLTNSCAVIMLEVENTIGNINEDYPAYVHDSFHDDTFDLLGLFTRQLRFIDWEN